MIADIPPLKFEVSGITRLSRNINSKKACGPDNISVAGFCNFTAYLNMIIKFQAI